MFNQARFLISLNHAPIYAKPQLCLVYAILAIAAPYHANPAVRSLSTFYYKRSRMDLEEIVHSPLLRQDVNPDEWSKAITVQTVQCCVLLTVMDFGAAHHQVSVDRHLP